ncbi:hypothetical protein RJ639_022369 [Escallonia herrerae]|uniref:DNA replication complex GINS protein SLD5 n=1 Tax=Escallonia herrerae TaxID=1293975 RepID=A0AA89AHS2_9ASTE|nr:hypothetical protein RJ639_022369 [Escallonia herrerae]
MDMDSGRGDGSGPSATDGHDWPTTDVELLKRAWRNEKAAPEILKYEVDLIRRVTELTAYVQETVDELMENGVDPLNVSLMEMDLERTLFLVKSYLRIRLQKIEKYMFQIQRSADLWNRLSRKEQNFAKRFKAVYVLCAEDMEKHLEQSVLSKLPDRYKSHLRQSITSEEDDMVPEPQLDTYVFCRSKSFLGSFQLDERQLDILDLILSRRLNFNIFGEGEPIDLEANELYGIRYRSIKPLIESGQMDLV